MRKKRFGYLKCTGCGFEEPHGQIVDFYQKTYSCIASSVESGMSILKVMLDHVSVGKRRKSQVKKQILFELKKEFDLT